MDPAVALRGCVAPAGLLLLGALLQVGCSSEVETAADGGSGGSTGPGAERLDPAAFEARKYNILFIAVDDLNAWTGHLGTHPQSKTPNIDRLAARGVSFRHAFAPSPVCNPARTALFTGTRPSTNGVYGNHDEYLPTLRKYGTLPQYFAAHGYETLATGKLVHRREANSELFHVTHDATGSYGRARPIVRIPALPERFSWGPSDVSDASTPDYERAMWAARQLERPRRKPFFLAVGIVRPHLPWIVPRSHFDAFPLDGIELPDGVLPGDRDDLPRAGRQHGGMRDHAAIVGAQMWKSAVQAYLASVHYADQQVGHILDALEASGHADDTIVVLWGDHGWQLGEKERWRKSTLWAAGSRTTLVVSVPGLTRSGSICEAPVDLMSLYPTLVDLAGLPPKRDLEGVSLRPLLADTDIEWEQPAITTHATGIHAVRYKNWGYIRYSDDAEELYDHAEDPHEWHNRAADPGTAGIRKQLAALLPVD